MEGITELQTILDIDVLKSISDRLYNKKLPEGYNIIISYSTPCKTEPCTGDCCRTFLNCNSEFAVVTGSELLNSAFKRKEG